MHRAVAGGDKTEIGCIPNECNSPFGREFVEVGADRGFRTGVVHHDDFRLVRILRGQHAFKACTRFRKAAINRNDDVDTAQGDLRCEMAISEWRQYYRRRLLAGFVREHDLRHG